MTIAYWCVLLAAGMPYLWILYAKATPAFVRQDYNKNPREYEEGLEGPRKRAYWAQLNAFEAFPPFAAGVIIAHLAGATQSTIDLLALAFLGLRFVHGLLYIADLDKLRSLVWFGALGCVVALFVVGV